MSSPESGQLLGLTLEKRVPGGEGLARHDGLTVFVPGGLPGDRVSARVISRKPSYARALIEQGTGFDTILKVIAALGLKLHAEAAHG